MSTEVLPANSAPATQFMPVMDISMAIARRDALVAFVKQIMKEGEDYGVIPGSKKPTLLKPGAEKLSSFFGLEPDMFQIEEIADWTGSKMGEPFYYIRYRCILNRDGRRLGMGEGSGSTWESKYRYRWLPEEEVPFGLDKTKIASKDGTRQCTEFEFAIDKSEQTGKYGKPADYWQAFKDAIGAGTARVGEREIKGQKKRTWTISIGSRLYRCPNPEFADLINTVQKIAQKRAFIAAILIATGASQFFSQDLEDLPHPPQAQEEAHLSDGSAQAATADAKLEELRQRQAANDNRMITELEVLRAALNDDQLYLAVLGRSGMTKTEDLLTIPVETRRQTGVQIYRELSAELAKRQEENRDDWVPENIGTPKGGEN